jgi:hypothetical protein
VKEYQELLLANTQRNSPRKENKPNQQHQPQQEGSMDLLKLGKYYIRKQEPELGRRIQTSESRLEKCDREYKDNPQYLVEYVRDIFQELRIAEVR